MKRADLKVGMEVLVSSSPTWRESLYRGEKAVVVDTRNWDPKAHQFLRGAKTVTTEDGTEVVVAARAGLAVARSGGQHVLVRRQWGSEWQEDCHVVPLSHVRGEYVQARAAQQERSVAVDESRRQERRAMLAREATRQDLMARIGTLLGHPVGLRTEDPRSEKARVSLYVEDLAALVEQAETREQS